MRIIRQRTVVILGSSFSFKFSRAGFHRDLIECCVIRVASRSLLLANCVLPRVGVVSCMSVLNCLCVCWFFCLFVCLLGCASHRCHRSSTLRVPRAETRLTVYRSSYIPVRCCLARLFPPRLVVTIEKLVL